MKQMKVKQLLCLTLAAALVLTSGSGQSLVLASETAADTEAAVSAETETGNTSEAETNTNQNTETDELAGNADVSAKYSSEQPSASDVVAYDLYKTNTVIYVKNMAGNDYTTLGTLSYGEEIAVMQEVLADNGDVWGKIEYEDKFGWISLELCTLIAEGNDTIHVETVTSEQVSSEKTETDTEIKTITGPEVTAVPETVMTGVTGTYKVTATSLNMRSGPSTSYGIVGNVKKDVEVNVTEFNVDGSWGKITYNGATGWISMQYTSKVTASSTEKEPEKQPDSSKAQDYKVTATALNVRSGPGSTYTKIASLTNGTVVSVVEKSSNNWGKIIVNGSVGWISLDFAVPVAAADPTTETTTKATTTTETTTKATTTTETTTATTTEAPTTTTTQATTTTTEASTTTTTEAPTTTTTEVPTTTTTEVPTTTTTEAPTTTTTEAPTTTTTEDVTTTTEDGSTTTEETTTETEASTTTTTELSTTTTTEASASGGDEGDEAKGDDYEITASSLNMRSGAGTTYAVVGSLSKGTRVTVTELSADGKWGKVTCNGVTGWISMQYASKVKDSGSTTKPETPEEPTTPVDSIGTAYKITASSLNVRAEAKSGASVVATVTKGATVIVTEISADGKWGKVTVNGKTGWISMAYASKVNESTVATTRYVVLATSLTLRQGPGASYKAVGTIDNKTIIVVTLITGDNWGKTIINGQTGWVNLSYCGDPSVVDNGTASSGSWKKVNGVWCWYNSSGKKLFSSNNMYNAWNSIKSKTSGTQYYICVNNSSCETFIFIGKANNWVPYKLWKCSPGATSTPTVKGTYTISDRGHDFSDDNKVSYTCYWWTRFYQGYLFHSVLYYVDSTTIKDGRLGYRLSHGCVRLAIGNAQWIYANCAAGTKVYSY